MNATIPDRDERLAELIARLTDELRLGQSPNVEKYAREQPDLAVQLRELWAIAQFAQLAHRPPLSTTLPLADGLHPNTHGPSSDSLAGPTLPRQFGDFELIAELGRGGMGVVYKARQKSLDRIVALKMVREAHLASSSDRARFQAEAEAAARLQHPNIVTVYEVGSYEDQAYICMEFVDSRTLGQKVAAEGPASNREAARLVATIALAVQHAHDHGILHRDLKPSNILLAQVPGSSADGLAVPVLAPKIADFGLAKRIDRTESLTRTGAVVGTPSYMAPEQATGGKDVTRLVDVYALGAILYELLTGRPPFLAATPVDTVLMVLEQEPIPPRELVPSVDRDIEMICLKCLQKPIDLRYESAAKLGQDLQAYLAGEPLSVQPVSFGSFVGRMLRETHHASVLENWGLLWMWHSLMIFLLCLSTQVLAWSSVNSHAAYLALWGAGLLTWGAIFWRLRRRGGPVLFVERQIAHSWAGGVLASIGLFVIEVVQGLESLTLSPVLPLLAATIFIVKAGTLSGQFYVASVGYFTTSILMAIYPAYGHLIFGFVSAVTFFVPGLKYYRQRKRALKGV